MALGKQAKFLSRSQCDAVLLFLATTRHPTRNRVIFLLSVKAGLRAKEIASLTWSMVTDAEGRLAKTIALADIASKGRSGRAIPINRELANALAALHSAQRPSSSDRVVQTERSAAMSAAAMVNMMIDWYRRLGFDGCSSHSGRRTFVTNAARAISTVGGSLKDVQMLAGHASLSTTQGYIEADSRAQQLVVDRI